MHHRAMSESYARAYEEAASAPESHTEPKPRKRILVIGAGPSGLVAVKTLVEHGFDAVCLEAGAGVGGTFVNKTYDEGRLVSSRFITAFSDFRMEAGGPDHPSIAEYVAYLKAYCDAFGLWPRLRFGCRVERVERVHAGAPAAGAGDIPPIDRGAVRYRVHHSGGVEACDAVCVCSGLHNVPYVPAVPGLAGFAGTVLHSSAYREKGMFAGRRVLVVGCGETGLDIVHRAVTAPARAATLAVRRGFLSVPTEGAGDGVPLDSMITNLFECSYVHAWAERLKLRWRVTTWFIRGGFLLATGSSVGFNQWAGGLAPAQVRRGWNIVNKSTAAVPYLNRATKRRSWLGRTVWGWADRLSEPGFELDPAPEGREEGNRGGGGGARCADVAVVRGSVARVRRNGTTVVFSDGTERDFDVIVFATGYKQRFPFLFARPRGRGEEAGGSGDGDDPLPEEHNVTSAAEPTLGFLGFVRPNVGAIPPMAELQCFWWVARLRGAIPGPRAGAPVTYRLRHAARHCPRTAAYACDYGAYMHDLARDLGAAPSLPRWCWRAPRVALAYALGQAYVTFFRLADTPFRDPGAAAVAGGELFRPVADRAPAAQLVFAATTLLFGAVNLACWALDALAWRPLRWAFLAWLAVARYVAAWCEKGTLLRERRTGKMYPFQRPTIC